MQINGEKGAIFWCKLYGVGCKGGDYSACTPRTRPNARNWLGELPQVHPITRALSGTPPRTRQPAEASAPIQLGANGQRKKNTRMAFRTINIGAHAKSI